MNLEKFTDRAKGFLQSAQTVAIRMNHQRISPEHILKALLEDEQGMASGLIKAAGGDAGRFIVQIGAFAESDKAQEARQKAERAGLKTYTQVVDTKDGKRTRVRVGPFTGRAEADKAASRVKGLGLPASVIPL